MAILLLKESADWWASQEIPHGFPSRIRADAFGLEEGSWLTISSGWPIIYTENNREWWGGDTNVAIKQEQRSRVTKEPPPHRECACILFHDRKAEKLIALSFPTEQAGGKRETLLPTRLSLRRWCILRPDSTIWIEIILGIPYRDCSALSLNTVKIQPTSHRVGFKFTHPAWHWWKYQGREEIEENHCRIMKLVSYLSLLWHLSRLRPIILHFCFLLYTSCVRRLLVHICKLATYETCTLAQVNCANSILLFLIVERKEIARLIGHIDNCCRFAGKILPFQMFFSSL